MTSTALAALLSLLPAALAAQGLVDSHFQPGTDCYRRWYDAAHLAAHPDQRVTEIAVGPWENRFDNGQMILIVEVHLRGDRQTYSGAAYCETGKALACRMEGDAGGLTIEADGLSILLRVAEGGMHFEGPSDFVEISGTTGDDRLFRLDPVGPGLCP